VHCIPAKLAVKRRKRWGRGRGVGRGNVLPFKVAFCNNFPKNIFNQKLGGNCTERWLHSNMIETQSKSRPREPTIKAKKHWHHYQLQLRHWLRADYQHVHWLPDNNGDSNNNNNFLARACDWLPIFIDFSFHWLPTRSNKSNLKKILFNVAGFFGTCVIKTQLKLANCRSCDIFFIFL